MAGITRRVALGIAPAALVAGAATQAQAASNPPDDLPDITDAAPVPDQVGGSVGIAHGQIARLSVHVRHVLGEIPPDPVDIALKIRNFNGAVLAERVVLGMKANQGAFVDFTHPGTGLFARRGPAGRIQLVGEVEHTRGYTIGASLEVIDPGTGSTVANITPCVIPAPSRANG